MTVSLFAGLILGWISFDLLAVEPPPVSAVSAAPLFCAQTLAHLKKVFPPKRVKDLAPDESEIFRWAESSRGGYGFLAAERLRHQAQTASEGQYQIPSYNRKTEHAIAVDAQEFAVHFLTEASVLAEAHARHLEHEESARRWIEESRRRRASANEAREHGRSDRASALQAEAEAFLQKAGDLQAEGQYFQEIVSVLEFQYLPNPYDPQLETVEGLRSSLRASRENFYLISKITDRALQARLRTLEGIDRDNQDRRDRPDVFYSYQNHRLRAQALDEARFFFVVLNEIERLRLEP